MNNMKRNNGSLFFVYGFLLLFLHINSLMAQAVTTKHVTKYVIRYIVRGGDYNRDTIRIGGIPCVVNDTIDENAIIDWGAIDQINIYNPEYPNKEKYVITKKKCEDEGIKTIAQYKAPRPQKSDQGTGAKRLPVNLLRAEAARLRDLVLDLATRDSINAVLNDTISNDSITINKLNDIIASAEKSIEMEFKPIVTNNPINHEKRLALIIGNNDYPDSIGRLKTPGYDAEDFSKVLRDSLGFETITVHNAYSLRFRKHLDNFVNILYDYKIGLFYYAGHGLSNSGNKDFVVLTDGERISYESIVEDLQISSKLLLLFFDACRNQDSLFTTDLARKDGYGARRNTMVMTSVQAGKTANDGVLNSPFSLELTSHICLKNKTVVDLLETIQENLGTPHLVPWKKENISYMLRPDTIKPHKPRKLYLGIEAQYSYSKFNNLGGGIHFGIQLKCPIFFEVGCGWNYVPEAKDVNVYETPFSSTLLYSYNYNNHLDIFARVGWNFEKKWFVPSIYLELADAFYPGEYKNKANAWIPSLNGRFSFYKWNRLNWYGTIGLGYQPHKLRTSGNNTYDPLPLNRFSLRLQLGMNFIFSKKK